MEVITISALSDNYMYLLIDKESKKCSAIDPVEPDKIIDTINQYQLNLTSILTTHHHSDHAGGNIDLIKKLKELGKTDIKVYGGDDRIDAITNTISHEDKIMLGNDSGSGAVFSGDTLFLGGCGRFFEGTPNQMYKALVEILSKLPSSTKVYCGHEYTMKNLEFAMTVEPDNQVIKDRLESVKKLRETGQFTVPGTIGEELLTNPFMRVTEPSVLAHTKTTDPIQAMEIIRKQKDNF